MNKTLILISALIFINLSAFSQKAEVIYFKANQPCCKATACNNLKNKVKDVENGFDSSRAHTDAFTTAITKNIMKVFQWAIATTAIYGSLRKIEEGVEYVTALNSEMTNIQIVTGNTTDEINKLSSEYNKLAKELGVTTLEVARGNLEWARQGKSAEDSAKLLRASVMLAKLANLDQAESTEYLTSIINGYKLSIEEVMPTIDKLINLDNSYASSVGKQNRQNIWQHMDSRTYLMSNCYQQMTIQVKAYSQGQTQEILFINKSSLQTAGYDR